MLVETTINFLRLMFAKQLCTFIYLYNYLHRFLCACFIVFISVKNTIRSKEILIYFNLKTISYCY